MPFPHSVCTILVLIIPVYYAIPDVTVFDEAHGWLYRRWLGHDFNEDERAISSWTPSNFSFSIYLLANSTMSTLSLEYEEKSWSFG